MNDLVKARVWPVMTLPEIQAQLCAPGQRFEMETVPISGNSTRTWKNAPVNLPALLSTARGHGEQLFCIYEDERVSYAAFYKAAVALSVELSRRGVQQGDRVALAMRNLPEWPVAFFAATILGAIIVPLNAWWMGEELDYALRDSGARLLICDAERAERVVPYIAGLPALDHVLTARAAKDYAGDRLESILGSADDWADLPDAELPAVDIAPDDSATIFYTSGTTGNPKGEPPRVCRRLQTVEDWSSYGKQRQANIT